MAKYTTGSRLKMRLVITGLPAVSFLVVIKAQLIFLVIFNSLLTRDLSLYSLTPSLQDVKMCSLALEDQMQMQVFFILGVLTLWLLGLSVVVFKIFKLFDRLGKGVKEDLSKKGFAEVNKRLDFLESSGKTHVQKIALIRFNPFKELGGDHSFCLAILDGSDNGVVITGLHTRDRTRVYMKEVLKGKAEHNLSDEEKRSLVLAQKK